MWMRCPKQWEFRYVKGLKVPPSGAMVLGSAYHGGLAGRFKYVLDRAAQPPPEYVTDIFDTEWQYLLNMGAMFDDEGENEQLPFDEIVWGDEDPGVLKDTGIRLLQAYEQSIAPSIQPVTVEQKETLIVGDVPIVLVTDLTTPFATIDHKVKKKRFSEAELQQSLQGTVYQMATGLPLEFHVALKQKTLAIDIQRTSRTDADALWFIGQAQSVWQAVHAGVFVPNDQGWHCDPAWCGYWHLCKGR